MDPKLKKKILDFIDEVEVEYLAGAIDSTLILMLELQCYASANHNAFSESDAENIHILKSLRDILQNK